MTLNHLRQRRDRGRKKKRRNSCYKREGNHLTSWIMDPLISKFPSKHTFFHHEFTFHKTRNIFSFFTCINFPKREELSLRTVRAFPKASRITLASMICCSTHLVKLLVTAQRYWRMNFVVSVCRGILDQLWKNESKKYLARTTLAANHAWLIHIGDLHIPVRSLGRGEDMRGHFADFLVLVLGDSILIKWVNEITCSNYTFS